MKAAGWVVAGLLLGCGPDAAEYGFVRTERADLGPEDGGEDEEIAPLPDEPLEPWDVAGADPLSGIFLVETTVQARLVIDLEATLVHRLRLVRRGAHVRQVFTACDLELPSVPGVAELTIPERLRRLVQSRPLKSEGEFFDSAEAVGATYVAETPDLVLGPGDDDEDGHEGVTLGAEAVVCDQPVDVYAALRIGAALRGRVVDADTLEGEATPTLEQEILGWSDECIAPAAALEIELGEGSTFRARRVGDAEDLDGNGNVSCPEIIRVRADAAQEGTDDEGT